MLTKEIILEKLKENKKNIRFFGVKSLSLIGSLAKDEQTDKSDIDFIVEFEKGRGGYSDYAGLLVFLQDIFLQDIDLMKKELIREEIKQQILEEKQYAAEI